MTKATGIRIDAAECRGRLRRAAGINRGRLVGCRFQVLEFVQGMAAAVCVAVALSISTRISWLRFRFCIQ